MITDIVQGLNSNHKVQSSMFKVQRIKSSKFKVQRIKIRSRCLNFLYIIVKEVVGERVKNE